MVRAVFDYVKEKNKIISIMNKKSINRNRFKRKYILAIRIMSDENLTGYGRKINSVDKIKLNKKIKNIEYRGLPYYYGHFLGGVRGKIDSMLNNTTIHYNNQLNYSIRTLIIVRLR